jgi:hypothetical protein
MFSLIRGRVMRVTKLDACGDKILGPDSVVVTDGFISIQMSAQTTTGTAITVTNANGKDCVSDTPAPLFTGYAITAAFCGVEPVLFSMMTGQPVVYAADGTTVVGFEETTDVDLDGFGFAIETWSAVPKGSCEAGSVQYGYFLLPFIKGGVFSDSTIQNDAVDFGIQGALTKDGQGWGVGPYDVVLDETSAPGPLNVALAANAHRHLELTTVAPPTAADGASALGVPATGATAGIPATTTPTNSYAPLDLAGATGLTASPSTAWTTGQYLLTRSGAKIHWSGTAWAAGAA